MSKIVEGIAKDLKSIPEKLKAKTGNIDKKKLILMNLPYTLAGYFCDKIAWLWRVSPGQDASAKMMAVMAGLEGLFSNPVTKFPPKRFADRGRVRHHAPPYSVFQSQERQEVPAWHGVRFCKVGNSKRY